MATRPDNYDDLVAAHRQESLHRRNLREVGQALVNQGWEVRGSVREAEFLTFDLSKDGEDQQALVNLDTGETTFQ